jgi:hypothetical protein
MRRLGLEVLEERAVPSGTGGGGPGPSSGGGSNSGSQVISGPGYPLVLTSGPTLSGTSGGSSQQVTLAVPSGSSPGGPGATLTVVPVMVTLSGSSGGPASTTTLVSDTTTTTSC